MKWEWRCGDCGTWYPETVWSCHRALDDYVALRGGTLESAIHGAVEKATAPLVRDAIQRLGGDAECTTDAT